MEMNRKCARGSWNVDHQFSIWFTEGYWLSHMASSSRLNCGQQPGVQSSFLLTGSSCLPKGLKCMQNCAVPHGLFGCAQWSMLEISKGWKVVVRHTKPRFCHYRLLNGISTLPFAQIGLCHQGKGVYHTKKKSKGLEKRWKITIVLCLGQIFS